MELKDVIKEINEELEKQEIPAEIDIDDLENIFICDEYIWYTFKYSSPEEEYTEPVGLVNPTPTFRYETYTTPAINLEITAVYEKEENKIIDIDIKDLT